MQINKLTTLQNIAGCKFLPIMKAYLNNNLVFRICNYNNKFESIIAYYYNQTYFIDL